METKKIPWYEPQIGEEERKLINTVLDMNYLNEGEFTRQFEGEICNLLRCKHAVCVTSGTIAMFLALKGLGVGFGDEVILPDISYIAAANAVDLCGAKPVFVDINPENLTIDVVCLSKALTEKTRAIIPVHVTGRATDMESILAVARKNNLYVVEDSCEAFMSKHKGKYLGTFGDAGCFSLSPFKIITTGQGGIIITDNDSLYESLKELKDQGRKGKGTGGDDIHSSIGYNFKLTNLQAAVGLGQLNYIEFRMKRIREIYNQYVKELEGVDGITIFKFNIQDGELPLWVDAWSDRRDELDKYLTSNNIDCRRFWFPVHTQAPYRLSDDHFPNSIRMSKRSIWLPSAFTLSEEDISTVCTKIKEFFAKY